MAVEAKQIQKKALPRAMMGCAFLLMLPIDVFALRVSFILLMPVAALITSAKY